MSTTQLSTATTKAREEFLDNLRQMATGSYLRDEDREFWEAPYPESAVDEAQHIIDGMLQAAQSVASSDEAELKKIAATLQLQNTDESADEQPTATTLAIAAVINQHISKLKELSAKHEDALLEDEEIKDLLALVEKLAVDLDADDMFVTSQAEAVCEA